MKSFSRRTFLKVSGGGIAAGAAALTSPGGALAETSTENVGRVTLPYPEKPIGTAAGMPANEAVAFNYPDEASPCVAVKMGSPVPGGVGPDGDIVAYSTLCTHMGCVVEYDPESRNLKCPCHFSMFDGEKGGQMVIGQATEKAPSIILAYDADNDSVTAVGVDGLIYGRQSNIL
jgi:arsenite oxidase small subunit